MKALIFSIFIILFITSGFVFFAYVGCGGDFFNINVGFIGGISFLCSLALSPLIFDFYKDNLE